MPLNSIQPSNLNIARFPVLQKQPVFSPVYDRVEFENPYIDKKPLIERKIISQDENINNFFEKISYSIFGNNPEAKYFCELLKCGAISLSSCAFSDLNNPKSAIGVKLDPKKTDNQNIAKTEQYLKDGDGIGINFSEFSNPCPLIKKMNDYFKFRQNDLTRPPAAIALLNITHPKILDFISLKDNVSYEDWCFDLSVVMDRDFLSKVDKNELITLDDRSTLPAREIYKKITSSMIKNGEPGIIFSSDRNYICDCCATAPLKPDESLVLGHINLSKFYNFQTNQIDSKSLSNLSSAAKILSKALKKLDKNPYIGVLGYGELLQRLNIPYGQKDALNILSLFLGTLQKQTRQQGVNLAISPTSTVSRLLKTTPGLDYKDSKNSEILNYYAELETIEAAQKYLDGNVSKTICLNKNNTRNDADKIVRYCAKNGIRGITIFVK